VSDTAQEGYLTLALQSAQGTAASTVTKGVRVTSNAVSGQSENLVADPEIGGGRDRDTAGVVPGGFSVSGQVEMYARFNQLGYLLLAAGFEEASGPVQDGTTGAWTHTFTPAATGPKFLTLESAWGRNRAIRRFSDCLVNELSLAVAGNDWVTATVDFLGINEAWQASPSVPVFPAVDPIGTYIGSAITLDTLGTYRLTDLEWTLANNLSDDEYVVGKRSLVDITPGQREVGFTGTLRLDGSAPAQVTDLYRAAMYGDKAATAPSLDGPYHTSATLVFGSRKLVGSSTTVRYGMEVSMPDVVLNAFPLEGSGADVIEASIEGNAFKGASPVSTIKLYNTVGTTYVAAP
jgi:hypothetical protein